MKLSTVISMTATLAFCSGCGSTGPLPPVNPLISQTAASKALGSGAIAANLVAPKTFVPGRIYHVKPDGKVFQICSNDFKYQNALKKLQPETANFAQKTVEDTVRGNIRLDIVGGIRANMSYKKVKVTGYRIDEVTAATTDGDTAKYITSNVASKCRKETLPNNRPYYVVTAVATGDKVDVTEQPILSIDKGFGILNIELGKEVATYSESDVIFGIKGQKVVKSK